MIEGWDKVAVATYEALMQVLLWDTPGRCNIKIGGDQDTPDRARGVYITYSKKVLNTDEFHYRVDPNKRISGGASAKYQSLLDTFRSVRG